MKFSVITVTYQDDLGLKKTLKSLSKIDKHRYELIIIDGGSKDKTLQIINENSAFIDRWVSEPDQGIYDAMNKGLDRASGDIVCFLNADDQYASSSVLSRVATLMHEYQLDALIGDVGFFHEADPRRMVRRFRSNHFTPGRLAWGWMPAHTTLYLRSAVYKRLGLFKTDYAIAADFDFICRVFLQPDLRICYVPKVLVKMQTGGTSTSGLKATLRLNREVLRACRENGLQTNIFKILSKYPAKFLELLSR